MRFGRWAAIAAWAIVALLAVAGFAAFSPRPAATTTTEARSASSDWGSVSGRVVAFAFGSGLRSLPEAAPPAEEDLLKELMAARTRPVLPGDGRPVIDAPARSSAPEHPTTAPETDLLSAASIAATPPPGELSEQGARAIVALFFAREDVDRALEIAYCESRWNPTARNPTSGAAGFFQQLPEFWDERSAAAGWEGADIFDAHANAAVSAWLVYEGGGWDHWTASQACWS